MLVVKPETEVKGRKDLVEETGRKSDVTSVSGFTTSMINMFMP